MVGIRKREKYDLHTENRDEKQAARIAIAPFPDLTHLVAAPRKTKPAVSQPHQGSENGRSRNCRNRTRQNTPSTENSSRNGSISMNRDCTSTALSAGQRRCQWNGTRRTLAGHASRL